MKKNKKHNNNTKKHGGGRRTTASRGNSHTVNANRREDYSLPTVTGVLDCKGDRFGFIPDALGDVFVAGKNLIGARHGDTVRAVIIGDRAMYDKRRREGRVIEILERNPLNIVATVTFRDNVYYAVPDDRHFGENVEITSLGGAREFDKVIIRLVRGVTEGGDRAEVQAVLGRFDEIGMDVKSVIVSHNLRTEFPQDVIDQANSYGDSIDAKEAHAEYRRDFRDEIIFTIDGSDSKDFDDAVSLTETENGYRLGVYIADVSQYVTPHSPLDREAYLRGTSVYLADRVIPMLPETLSNGLCSLNEGEDRLVLAALIDLDRAGRRTGYTVCEGVIRSTARLTYTGVQAMLDGDEELRKKYERVVPTLELMKELALKRIAMRKERGAIDFKLTETQITFDAAGHVKDIEKKPSLLSMRIIEEFMILANCAVAEKFAAAKIPFVYRAHERPSAEKLQALNDYLEAVGAKARCPLSPSPKQVSALLESVDENIESAVSRVTLRSMAKATYEPMNIGHYGLAEEYYCHFTSPIRRYPDLFIHRTIKAFLHGGAAAARKYRDAANAAAKQSSKQERVAQDCERRVDDYKKAEYMSHRIGEKFKGVISSVTDFGFFVELDNSAEGLVRMAAISPSAAFDGRRMCIHAGKRQYRLGDSVEIRVDKVTGDRVDFSLV